MTTTDTPVTAGHEAAFLVALAEHGISPDVQDLLVAGDGRGTVAPGALRKALRAALASAPAGDAIILISQDDGVQTHGLFATFEEAQAHAKKDGLHPTVQWINTGPDRCEASDGKVFWTANREPMRSASRTGQWCDFATAPKDGTRIDVWAVFTTSGARRVTDCYWSQDHSDWYIGQYRIGQYETPPEVTHWMRPPAAPGAAPAGDGYGKWHPMLLDIVNAIHGDRGEKTQAIGIDLSYKQALAASLARPHSAVAPAGDGVERFVIRRNGAFFRPNAQGYTNHVIAAGFYTCDEADHYADVEGVTIEPLDRYRDDAERTIAQAQRLLAALARPRAAGGEREALIAELSPLIDKAAGPNGWDWMFPLRVKPVDGKPTIVSHKGGNVFRGYIGTWQEADLLVALANAAPRIILALQSPAAKVG